MNHRFNKTALAFVVGALFWAAPAFAQQVQKMAGGTWQNASATLVGVFVPKDDFGVIISGTDTYFSWTHMGVTYRIKSTDVTPLEKRNAMQECHDKDRKAQIWMDMGILKDFGSY